MRKLFAIALAGLAAWVAPVAAKALTLHEIGVVRLATHVLIAEKSCAKDYVVRTRSAAMLIDRMRPYVDPNRADIQNAMEAYDRQLQAEHLSMSREEACERLFGLLGDRGNVYYKLPAPMMIRRSPR